MSLWYDIKNKVYSSGPMDNWYIAYTKKICDELSLELKTIFSKHAAATDTRHKAEDIDFSSEQTVKAALEKESLDRITNDSSLFSNLSARILYEKNTSEAALALKVDKVDGKQLSTNDYTNEEKAIVSKTVGKNNVGEEYACTTLGSMGEENISFTSEKCNANSEIFNNYSGNCAFGAYSHAEGDLTSARGTAAHCEGSYSTANGNYSHAEGYGVAADSDSQHVQGKLNISDTQNKYAHIVGNGYVKATGANHYTTIHSNAHTLDWDGNAWFLGDVKCGDAELGLQEQITALEGKRPDVSVTVPQTLAVNTIYDIDTTNNISISLPSGSVGDWIKFDFISGEVPPTLTIDNTNTSNITITPEANTIYSIYFDWGRLNSTTYGWRVSYSEYTKVVA